VAVSVGMGAGASALPPTEQQTLQKQQMQLSEKAGVSNMGASEREHFEQKLQELYAAHGGNQIFQESSERQQEILLTLERETEKLGELALESNFRKRRLSYSLDPRHLRAIADKCTLDAAAGKNPRRPSYEFRSPPFLSAQAAGLAPNRSNRRLKVKPSDDGATQGVVYGIGPNGTTTTTTAAAAATSAASTQPASSKNGHGAAGPQLEPPFDDATLGTYSHHGIEPKYYGEGFTSKINQDRGCVVHPYVDSETQSLFCVFDGHGERGDEVSEFVLEQIVARLEADADLATDPEKALVRTFVATDEDLRSKADIDSFFSGTTAVVVYRCGNAMYTANAGDSRAVLARTDPATGRLVAVPLSIDQNPDTPGERQRIEASGGFVSDPPGEGLSARVWLDRNMTRVGLAMARSIGDNAVKKVGVIAEPEVRTHVVTEADAFMIIASDGVWEFISSEDAVRAVAASLEATKSASAACKNLIDLAIQCWKDNEGDYRDDITAIVMRLAPYPPEKSA